ncbi:MAG: hypothetical protein CVU62_05720 [Deltaproteobacteria bacterium HGW-Deltaproteobacteria-2]|jgi:hypothetical protein|nr:MAG: hypothetical protein CVU62_05720 [Deltaproteobacteria bacterium HGW-Deltaproteobacteria-2]
MPDVFKKYVFVISSVVSSCLIIIVLGAFYIQPLEGELTRLGSYAERDFGWNIPQRKIKGYANIERNYSGKSDVLIIGDSFSTSGVWQPFLFKDIGLSYETLNIRETSIPEFLQSKQFKNNPPKVLILQCVERELVYFFNDIKINCQQETNQEVRIPILRYSANTHAEYYEEKRKIFDIKNINLKYAASVVTHSIIRNITGKDTRNTKRFILTKNNLFSNRRSGEILVYEGDMNKLSWKKDDVAKTASAIKCIQESVQSNGKTLFIFMLAPDKSTAYADYITIPLFKKRENISNYLMTYGINIPRIDKSLKAAIARGEKDIYSPSGTHWSARGYEMAASGIAEFIRQYSL